MRQKALGLLASRKHSEDVRKATSDNRKGENSSFFGKFETKAKLRELALNRPTLPGNEVEVLDLKTN